MHAIMYGSALVSRATEALLLCQGLRRYLQVSRSAPSKLGDDIAVVFRHRVHPGISLPFDYGFFIHQHFAPLYALFLPAMMQYTQG